MRFSKIKNLFLIDFEEFFFDVKVEVESFYLQTGVSNKKDLLSLTVCKFFNKIINFHESISESSGLVYLVVSQKFLDELLSVDPKKNLVNYKKLVRILMKDARFNTKTVPTSYKDFCAELEADGFLYDELLLKAKNFSAILPSVCKVIRGMKFSKLKKDVVDDILSQMRLCGALNTNEARGHTFESPHPHIQA